MDALSGEAFLCGRDVSASSKRAEDRQKQKQQHSHDTRDRQRCAWASANSQDER